MRGPYRALGQRPLASPGTPEQHGPQSRLRPVPSVGQLPGVSWGVSTGRGGEGGSKIEKEIARERERGGGRDQRERENRERENRERER